VRFRRYVLRRLVESGAQSVTVSHAICTLVLAVTLAGGQAAAAERASTLTPAAAEIASSNEAAIRRQIDMLNHGDWRGALQIYSDDTKNFGRPLGRAIMARLFEDIYTTFPDFHMAILDIIAQGDWVVVRGRSSGTHKGMGKIPLNGGLLVGVAPTNRHFEVDVIHWYKMIDGKIIDHYDTRDDLSMMQQLGLSPQPKPFDWDKLAAEANGRNP
jgi:predicted ester cyclase